MFVLMFEFIYYVSVIWQVKLDFDGGLSYWVENEMGQNWQIPIHVWSIFEIIRDVWKGQIFLCDWVLERGIREPLPMKR